MKQTAVEWLVEQMINQMSIRIENTEIGVQLFEQAKEIEKEQTIAFADKYDAYVVQGGTLTAEQYYKQTYGGENE
jgi:hypothetical protein